jgi:hypothetical protein
MKRRFNSKSNLKYNLNLAGVSATEPLPYTSDTAPSGGGLYKSLCHCIWGGHHSQDYVQPGVLNLGVPLGSNMPTIAILQ